VTDPLAPRQRIESAPKVANLADNFGAARVIPGGPFIVYALVGSTPHITRTNSVPPSSHSGPFQATFWSAQAHHRPRLLTSLRIIRSSIAPIVALIMAAMMPAPR
jgi:hypothetical protein